MHEAYKLIPLQETQSIPVNWIFTQDEYDKLLKGHRSNWCIFLRDDVVHFCRVGGEEFYRFALKKISEGTFATAKLDAYVIDDFIKSLKARGLSDEEAGVRQADFRRLAIEEVAGFLTTHFDIDVAGSD